MVYLAADYIAILIIIAFKTLFCSKDKECNKWNVYYLDNSFSMQAKGKQGELLKRAVQELLEETLKTLLFFTNELWKFFGILNQFAALFKT
jgi:hypothetical protein